MSEYSDRVFSESTEQKLIRDLRFEAEDILAQLEDEYDGKSYGHVAITLSPDTVKSINEDLGRLSDIEVNADHSSIIEDLKSKISSLQREAQDFTNTANMYMNLVKKLELDMSS